MNIERGGIYVLAKEWNPYKQPIIDHRPIIVLKIHKDYVEAVSMGMLFRNSKKKNQLMIEYYVGGQKYIAAISCDIIRKIPLKYIQSYVGYVDDTIVELIEKQSDYFNSNDGGVQTEKKHSSNSISEGVTITNDEEHNKIIEELRYDMKMLIEFVEDSKKLKNIWKERLIGFIFGIISSIIASAIFENSSAFSNILWNIIRSIENLINM